MLICSWRILLSAGRWLCIKTCRTAARTHLTLRRRCREFWTSLTFCFIWIRWSSSSSFIRTCHHVSSCLTCVCFCRLNIHREVRRRFGTSCCLNREREPWWRVSGWHRSIICPGLRRISSAFRHLWWSVNHLTSSHCVFLQTQSRQSVPSGLWEVLDRDWGTLLWRQVDRGFGCKDFHQFSEYLENSYLAIGHWCKTLFYRFIWQIQYCVL